MLVMNWAVLTLICFVSVKCYENQTLQEDDNKVIGGNDAQKSKFTFLARLANKNVFLLCSGILIHRRYVLTAKHCVDKEFLVTGLKVVLGDYNRVKNENSEQHILVTEVKKHPNSEVDVAILKLKNRATLNEHVSVIKMATKESQPGEDLVKLVGWGITVSNGDIDDISKKLQVLNVPLVARRKCKQEGLTLFDKEECYGKPDAAVYEGACEGDSGSPLSLRDTTQDNNFILQAMVVAGHETCPSDTRHFIAVSIPKVYPWILNKIGCFLPGTWTEYFDEDDPRDKEDPFGDHEKASVLRPCGDDQPLCAECKQLEGGACLDPSSKCAKKQVYKCKRTGLFCLNKNQVKYQEDGVIKKCSCCDYSVRFKCPL